LIALLCIYRVRFVARVRRHSPQTVAVVLVLAEEPSRWRYGYELSRRLEIKAGSIYPILMRLTDRGLLETAWETDAPAGRPPRHLYRLTSAGRALAGDVAQGAAASEGAADMTVPTPALTPPAVGPRAPSWRWTAEGSAIVVQGRGGVW
jgi:DNA-binding PadR family transcriptional regulator